MQCLYEKLTTAVNQTYFAAALVIKYKTSYTPSIVIKISSINNIKIIVKQFMNSMPVSRIQMYI